MNTALDAGIKLWHPATELVSVGELYHFLTGKEFVNELNGIPANYDYRTIHDEIFARKNGYICDKDRVMKEIKAFVEDW